MNSHSHFNAARALGKKPHVRYNMEYLTLFGAILKTSRGRGKNEASELSKLAFLPLVIIVCVVFLSGCPPFKVLSPSKSDIWERGKPYVINWQTTGQFAAVTLVLRDGFRKQDYPIATDIANSGTFTYTVPSDQKTSGPYYVRVISSTNPGAAGSSEPFFVEDWDWMQDNKIDIVVRRTDVDATNLQLTVDLPYFSSEGPVPSDIRPTDMNPSNGWTFLSSELGSLEDPVIFPRMIFYNRYSAVLRLYYFYGCSEEQFTHGIVKLRRHIGNLPALFTFMDELGSESLESYSQDSELTYIGELERPVWNYADFMMAYDPNPLPNSTLEFEIIGVDIGDIAMTGTLALEQTNIMTSKAGEFNAGQALTTVWGAAQEAWTTYRSVDELGEYVEKKTKKGGDWEKSWFGPTLKKAFAAGGIAYVAGAGAAIAFIVGALLQEEGSPAPLQLSGEIDLSGTITTMTPMPEFFMRIPGVQYTDPSLDMPKPKYDELLGIYNLTRMPTMWYTSDVGDVLCSTGQSMPLFQYREVRTRYYHRPHQIDMSLFELNPLFSVLISVGTVAPDSFPDFFESSQHEAYQIVALEPLERIVTQEIEPYEYQATSVPIPGTQCWCGVTDLPWTTDVDESDPLRCAVQRRLAVHVQVFVPGGNDCHFFKSYKMDYVHNESARPQ
jgi:hypothetical protein